MQKGSFKCRSFHFTGDGRNQLNDGTAAGSNGITVNNMAISILCNAAACFIESGEWVEDSSMLSGASTMTIRANTISFLTYSYTADYSQPTTPYVYYTYLKRAGISDYASAAKIMLMYQATKGIAGINELTGGFSGTNNTDRRFYQFVDCAGSPQNSAPSCAQDLSLLYLPPNGGSWSDVVADGGTNAHNLRVMSLAARTTWSYACPISCHNTQNSIYSYHFLTSENNVGLFFTSSEESSIIRGFVCGDLLDPSSLGPRDNSNFRTYAAFSTQCSNANASGTYGLIGNDSSYMSKNYDLPFYTSASSMSNIEYPITQFYTPSGLCCSAGVTNKSTSTTNGQLICWVIPDMFCALQNVRRTAESRLNVTPIGIGIMPSTNYSVNRFIYLDDISGSCYKGKFDTNLLFSSGRQASSGVYLSMEFTPGDLFDNGNYIHLGDGIWMGWHPDNGSMFTNTGDEMVVYTPPAA